MSPSYPVTIYTDPAIGLTVTAWQHWATTRCWSVRFSRRNTDLDQISHWTGVGWNRSRLQPSALPLIPPAALAAVEAWLAKQAAEVVK